MSLQAQREAIERYAAHNGLSIRAWFEETETAARRGRPAFGEMLARLEAGDARGVVIHKIDRGARNLRDWADLAELVDRGLEIHFANENLDLRSRGGRLSADIQAVVAADFIRNLREETRKGFYGRLRQGLYPLPAPIGYLNRGRGQPKEVDPERAPLVREAFVLYASGRHTLDTLRRELRARGYGRRDGGALSRNCLSLLLTNPFYAGVIRLRVTGETFPGIHERLVSPTLFARVQSLLQKRALRGSGRHHFSFARLLSCAYCGRLLTGEVQKGHRYYRCHSKGCATKCLREEDVDRSFRRVLRTCADGASLLPLLRSRLKRSVAAAAEESVKARAQLAVRLKTVDMRLDRLTDAYLDSLVEKDEFDRRRGSILLERSELSAALEAGVPEGQALELALRFLDRCQGLHEAYDAADWFERRQIVEVVTSNRVVRGRELEFSMRLPYSLLTVATNLENSDPSLNRVRTGSEAKICDEILVWFSIQRNNSWPVAAEEKEKPASQRRLATLKRWRGEH